MLDIIGELINLVIKALSGFHEDPHQAAIDMIQAHKRAAEIDAEIDAKRKALSRP